MKKRSLFWPLFFGLAISPFVAQAEEENDDTTVIEIDDEEEEELDEAEGRTRAQRLGRIDVIGEGHRAVDSVPGSATVVTREDLDNINPISGNEVFRSLPGVHSRDEEGIGLRPNIGIRGLDPSRARTLLVLEDGVPIALAPYGEPELYYAPQIERAERLELVKGSGSVLFGPQTIGGVLNLITPAPPEELTITAEARAGSFGYYFGSASVGDTVGRLGYRLGVMHLRYAGPRALNLALTDVTGQLRYQLTDDASLGLKLHFYDEISNATYLGLTTPQFEENRNFNFAENDVLAVQRFAASATYEHFLTESVLFQTTVYGHNISRFWNRQDFDRTDEGRDYERVIDGRGNDITNRSVRPNDGSAIYMRDGMGDRQRTFFVGGVEPRVTVDYRFGEVDNELIAGFRVHGELTNESRVDSSVSNPEDQTVREQEVRTGVGIAAYALNRFMFLDRRLKVSPGIRIENYWNEREITRTRVGGIPTDLETPIGNAGNTFALIPGLGVSYALTEELTAFAGVHRGFSPPRTKDAITNDGALLELDAEFSVNYELGMRARVEDWLSGEVSGFVLNFSNQIIPPSEFGGAVSDADLVNAGETFHYGVEGQVNFDAATFFDLGFRLPVGVTYTWVQAEFGEEWAENIAGNRLPYAPEHRLSTFLRFGHDSGIAAQITAFYVSEQYTDKGNRENPSLDGLVGKLDPYFLLDANVSYTLSLGGVQTTAFLAAKNITDEYYIASRAPRGIQPGVPRQIMGGLRGQF